MATVDWGAVEKIAQRELTRARGPSGRAYETDAATAAKIVGLLQADPCGAQGRLLAVESMPAYRAVACYAAIFARLAAADQADILDSLDDPGWTTCASLALSYASALSLSNCPSAVLADPAYESAQAVAAASWNPYDPNAGPRWTPGYQPGGAGGGATPVEPLGSKRPTGSPPSDSAAVLLAMCQGGDRNACGWLAYCQRVEAQEEGCGFYCELDPKAKGCAGAVTEAKEEQPPWYMRPSVAIAGGTFVGALVVGAVVAVTRS